MKKSVTIYFIVFLIFFVTSCQSGHQQENQTTFDNSNGNKVIQVNLKIENIETNAPITNGNIVLVINDKKIGEAPLNNQGLANLSIDKSFENKNTRLLIKDSEGNEQYSQDYILKETQGKPKKIAIQPFKRFVIDEIRGKIAQGATNEYTFQAEPNYPLLIQVKSSGSLSYYLQILNSSTEVIVNKGTFGNSTTFNNIPFTAPKKDTYTIKVIGYRGEGNYVIHIVYVDSKNDKANSKLRLIENQQHYDRIGAGSYDSYLFKGIPNNTTIIQTKSKGNLSYYVQLLNPIGERILNKGSYGYSEKYHNIPFTPKDSGQYEIRVLGYKGFGTYDIRYYNLEDPISEQIKFGTIRSATLGQNAYHDYQFTGTHNKSIRIKTMGLNSLSYYVQVYNASGEQLLNEGSYGYSEKYHNNLFTPKKDGDYIIRIYGYRNYGGYKVLLEEI